jgi:hypothetical protein
MLCNNGTTFIWAPPPFAAEVARAEMRDQGQMPAVVAPFRLSQSVHSFVAKAVVQVR